MLDNFTLASREGDIKCLSLSFTSLHLINSTLSFLVIWHSRRLFCQERMCLLPAQGHWSTCQLVKQHSAYPSSSCEPDESLRKEHTLRIQTVFLVLPVRLRTRFWNVVMSLMPGGKPKASADNALNSCGL